MVLHVFLIVKEYPVSFKPSSSSVGTILSNIRLSVLSVYVNEKQFVSAVLKSF